MTITPEHTADLEQLKRALVAVRKLRARVDELEQAEREPIAIVGLGCRLPGNIDTPTEFWNLLREGRDAIGEVPMDRWDGAAYWSADNDTPGKIPTRFGGFLSSVDQFDPHFFGISPREAAAMDPQQRLVLEAAWEALEDAAIPPQSLAGSLTGVFIGIGLNDYGKLQAPAQAADPSLIGTYTTSGNALCITANRLSYLLDLHGPSMAIDTACSSSLVATQQACRSIWDGDSELALIGGSNVILAPDTSVSLSKFLAPDGRCKFGDARADGYVRGEGVVMMVLMPLSRATAEDRRIYALIRGAAVNQDGYSSGLTVPNGVAQQAMLRAALVDARVSAHEVSYVEAHGTGTSLGDPIEIQALGAVLGAGRPADQPLWVGSVKANIGHLEAGAGIAGMLKATLALWHGEIPPSLHFEKPNPHIPFEQLGVRIPTERTAWPEKARRIAGVSSFGFGGTNAHVILEAPPVSPTFEAQPVDRSFHVLPLSAKDSPALHDLVKRYATMLEEQPNLSLSDLCATAASGRSHFAERAAFVATTSSELREQLGEFTAGELLPGVQSGRVERTTTAKLAFLFTGQGSQYVGMGRTLYKTQPSFRATIDQCAELLRPELEHDLRAVIFGESEDTAALLDQTAYTQPALFALEYALAQLWMSWGIIPAAVLGHSVGEYVAACIAGVFSLEDGLRLIAARGRLMQSLPSGGAMAAIFAAPERVQAALQPYDGRVVIAAFNEPEHIVIAGDEDAVESVRTSFADTGVKARRLVTSHAFHSPLMDPILGEFERVAATVTFSPPKIPLAANLTGGLWAKGRAPDATYWKRHLREPVQFVTNIQALHQLGCEHFVEIGPAPVLAAAGSRCLANVPALWLASLRNGTDDWQTLLKSLGALYVAGINPNWNGFEHDYPRRQVTLPTYPFQRERYWFDAPSRRQIPRPIEQLHPLIDRRLRSPALTHPVFETELSVDRLPLLDGHRVFGTVVVPATAYVELVLAAAEQAFGSGAQIAELLIHQPLAVADDSSRTVQIMLGADEVGDTFEVLSQAASRDEWLTHASGRLVRGATEPSSGVSLAAAQAACQDELAVAALYARFEAIGLGYGPAFRGLRQIWRGTNSALALIRLPESHAGEVGAYGIHPALLDACLQTFGVLFPNDVDILYLPITIEGFRRYATGNAELWSYLQLDDTQSDETLAARLRLFDTDGTLVAEADQIVLKQARRSALAPQAAISNWFYEIAWQPQPSSKIPSAAAGRWLIVDSTNELGAQLAAQLSNAGAICKVATPDADLRQLVEEGSLRGAVFISSTAPDDPMSQQEQIVGGALRLAQTLAQRGATKLWLVTSGAQGVDVIEPTNPAQATLWGLGRVIGREYPELGCVCVDLDPAHPDAALSLLAAELLGKGDEDQLAFRDGERFVARLIPRQPAPADTTPMRLEIAERGTFEQLELRPVEPPKPGPDEVLIRVHAAGLNFRDVLNTLGLYPGEAGGLGNECAGVVEAIGASVEGLSPGDAVLAIASDCLGDFALAKAVHTLHKPAGISFAGAATVPIAFGTAAYALRYLARIKPGDRVLIHAAAGGVGLAAVQIAQLAGAEVIGTAGSPEKRAFLHDLGVQNVFDSRSLSFADDIRALTNGAGVDIVLNSLAGDFIPASLDVLRDGGCFLEIGKRDIWEPEQVAALKRNIDYHIIYLGENIENEPALVREILAQLVNEIRTGVLTPLPLRIFSLAHAADAFRFMAQARHIGKVVLQPAIQHPLVRSDGSYLITGGLGGIGLNVARWLVESGARHLALVSRRAPSAAAETQIAELIALGAQVLVAQTDVADRDSLATLLGQINATMPPLLGIIHAAGTLDDGPLVQQTWERSAAVLAPKVAGAWALHELTTGCDLDWFVMFSAGAALIGAPGQSNYAAANSFLDSLAQLRRAHGLPALSINWGAWGEVGMAATLGERERQRLADQGMLTIAPEDGLRALAAAMQDDVAQLAIIPADWNRFAQQFAGRALPSLFRDLAQPVAAASTAPARTDDIVARLAKTAPGNRRALLRTFVREHAGRILALAPSRAVDPRQPLSELGLDSLMAVELRNSLGGALGRSLPTTLLFDYPTIEALTGFLEALLAPPAVEERSATPALNGDLAADLEHLSDEEAEALLLAELDGWKEGR